MFEVVNKEMVGEDSDEELEVMPRERGANQTSKKFESGYGHAQG
jgi:hypothetical protein